MSRHPFPGTFVPAPAGDSRTLQRIAPYASVVDVGAAGECYMCGKGGASHAVWCHTIDDYQCTETDARGVRGVHCLHEECAQRVCGSALCMTCARVPQYEALALGRVTWCVYMCMSMGRGQPMFEHEDVPAWRESAYLGCDAPVRVPPPPGAPEATLNVRLEYSAAGEHGEYVQAAAWAIETAFDGRGVLQHYGGDTKKQLHAVTRDGSRLLVHLAPGGGGVGVKGCTMHLSSAARRAIASSVAMHTI